MGRRAWFLGLIGIAGTAWLVAAGCDYGSTTQQAAVEEDSLALGERLTYVSGCQDCHTPGTCGNSPDYARQLSGSDVGRSGAWGVSFAKNLTPDMETGLGSWTEEQIAVAIRTGMRPDGTQLLPPMPWPLYSKMTEREARSLAKFLKSLPAVSHQVPAVIPPGQAPPADLKAFLAPPALPAWDGQHMSAAAGGGQ